MGRRPTLLGALGPAFVAAIAYVDPGNVATNLTAGATYSYALVWVPVTSSVMAVVIQYQSAKLGVVTGRSLSSLVAEHLGTARRGQAWRRAYALQAIVMAIATDVAEVVGGALALQLLFGLPLWLGGLAVGLVTLAALEVLRSHGERTFEIGISAFLGVIAVGYVGSLVFAPPDLGQTARGLRPGFPDAAAVPLTAAMLGATVMPHAIYLHSTLAADRHRRLEDGPRSTRELLRIQRIDVLLALLVAGTVNIAMLLFAASALAGRSGTDSIASAHATITAVVGPAPGTVFALGLLVSSLASSLVGTHAGARIMHDLVPWRTPPMARRAATIIPAALLLAIGLDPTRLLVDSQLALSFGIVFALVPLTLMTGSRRLMGRFRDHWPLRAVSWVVVGCIVTLNAYLLCGTLA